MTRFATMADVTEPTPRTIHGVPAGTRIRWRSAGIGVSTKTASAKIDGTHGTVYEAVATEKLKRFPSGEMRRLFTDCRPPFAGLMDEVWLNDATLPDEDVAAVPPGT